MEEHELKLQVSEGELVTFVKEVSNSFRDLSERKKIDFDFNSNINRLYTLFNHDKIERILFNLLSNAFKFTLEGGKISLALQMENYVADDVLTSWVSIKISDAGTGIPEDKRHKIFERFFQTTMAASIFNQGTGIGLSITKEFVKLHGGTIDVESEPREGATFTIHLPFTPIETPSKSAESLSEDTEQSYELEQLDELIEQREEVESVINKIDKPSILLVEDNEDFRFYLKDNLRLHYKVFEAANGKEGWEKAR
jgi:signal transduction histidine kinase